jgi:hypothetical protein
VSNSVCWSSFRFKQRQCVHGTWLTASIGLGGKLVTVRRP